jgi:hypothetical protein
MLKKCMPQVLLAYVRTFGEWVRSGKSSATGGRPVSREGIFQLAARAGASTALLAKQQQELLDVEQTMENGDFINFLQVHAPELLLPNKHIPRGTIV